MRYYRPKSEKLQKRYSDQTDKKTHPDKSIFSNILKELQTSFNLRYFRPESQKKQDIYSIFKNWTQIQNILHEIKLILMGNFTKLCLVTRAYFCIFMELIYGA